MSIFTNDVVSRKASVAKLKGMFELVPEAMDVFRQQWNAKFNENIADIRTRYTAPPTPGDDLWNAQRIWTEQRGTAGEKAALKHPCKRLLRTSCVYGPVGKNFFLRMLIFLQMILQNL